MEHVAKGALRSVKNVAKGYSEVQVKVREATSNDPWGPSGSLMAEISEYTYNHQGLMEIMDIVSKRLNDSGKNWRHVFKSLLLLDYLIHTGSENIINYAKDNLYIIKTLKEFQYIDEEGKDQGINIRQKSKDLTNLLQDDARLVSERAQRKSMKNRIGGRGDNDYGSSSSPTGNYSSFGAPSSEEQERRDLERAIEESKRTAKEHEERYASRAIPESRPAVITEKKAEPAAPNLLDLNSPQEASFDPFSVGGGASGPNVGFQAQQQQAAFNPFQQQQMYQQPVQQAPFNPFQSDPFQMQQTNNPFQQQQQQQRVPFQVQQQMRNDANNNLATIARNTPAIDPFASIATGNDPIAFGTGEILQPTNSAYGNNADFGSNGKTASFTTKSSDPFSDIVSIPGKSSAPASSSNNPFAPVNNANAASNKTLGQLTMEKMSAGFGGSPMTANNINNGSGVPSRSGSPFVHPFSQPMQQQMYQQQPVQQQFQQQQQQQPFQQQIQFNKQASFGPGAAYQGSNNMQGQGGQFFPPANNAISNSASFQPQQQSSNNPFNNNNPQAKNNANFNPFF